MINVSIKYGFVFISILFQSFSFVFSKLAALSIDTVSISIFEYIFNPYYLASIVCLVIQAFFWQKTLEKMELSKAYPFTGLVYILILIYTYVIFNEQIYLNNFLGTLIILLGVYIINLEEKG